MAERLQEIVSILNNMSGTMHIDEPWYSISIDHLGLSNYSNHALKRNGIFTIGELMECNNDALRLLRQVGAKCYDEIISAKKAVMVAIMTQTQDGQPATDTTALSLLIEQYNIAGKEVDKYTEANAVGLELWTPIERLDFSTRAKRILLSLGVRNVKDLLEYDTNGLILVRGVGQCTITEIVETATSIRNAMGVKTIKLKPTFSSLPNVLFSAKYIDVFRDFVSKNDVSVEYMAPPLRVKNALSREGINNVSEFMFLSVSEISLIRGIGFTNLDFVIGMRERWIKDHEMELRKALKEYDSKMVLPPPSDSAIEFKIVKLYTVNPHEGIDVYDICDKCTNIEYGVDESQVRRCLDNMCAAGRMTADGDTYFMKYPRFVDEWKRSPPEGRTDEIIKLRMSGETLEAIAKKYSVSRQRIEQIISKSLNIIRESAKHNNYGCGIFEEDRYKRLFKKYYMDNDALHALLGFEPESYGYLFLACAHRGRGDLRNAVDDVLLDKDIRERVRAYLIKTTYVMDDGVMVELERNAIFRHLIERNCKDDMHISRFVQIYNKFLEKHHIDDPSLRLGTEGYSEITQSEKQIISKKDYVLWKQGERIRFYDINAIDSERLIDALDLGRFHNTRVTTQKFMDENPALMAEYDIRDKYELHNILRKVIQDCRFDRLQFIRTPSLLFGDADTYDLIFNSMREKSPISKKDFIKVLCEEYGFDARTIQASYLPQFSKYCKDGIYDTSSVNEIDEEKASLLISAMPDGIQHIEDVRALYAKMFPEEDPNVITDYCLRRIGIQAKGTFVIKGFRSIEDLIRDELTMEDQVYIPAEYNIKTMRMCGGYYGILNDLKASYEIIEYEPRRFINIRALEEMGVTKDDIKAFCDKASAIVRPGQYFTMMSLRKCGFKDKFDTLPYSDFFYASILASDSRFTGVTTQGTLIICKTNKRFKTSDFCGDIVKNSAPVTIDSLKKKLFSDYGLDMKRQDVYMMVYRGGGHVDPESRVVLFDAS